MHHWCSEWDWWEEGFSKSKAADEWLAAVTVVSAGLGVEATQSMHIHEGGGFATTSWTWQADRGKLLEWKEDAPKTDSADTYLELDIDGHHL